MWQPASAVEGEDSEAGAIGKCKAFRARQAARKQAAATGVPVAAAVSVPDPAQWRRRRRRKVLRQECSYAEARLKVKAKDGSIPLARYSPRNHTAHGPRKSSSCVIIAYVIDCIAAL